MPKHQRRSWMCTDPEVIAAIENIGPNRKAAADKIQGYFDEHWEGRTGRIWMWGDGFRVVGMTDEKSNNKGETIHVFENDRREPPTGWRWDKKDHLLVPAKRTDEGKALAKVLQGLDYKGTPIPGELPDTVSSVKINDDGQSYFLTCRSRTKVYENHFGKCALLYFEHKIDKRDVKRIESDGLWKPIMLSAYWSSVETSEDHVAEMKAAKS